MRLKPEQLPTALKKSLAPVYLVFGDEPLQLGEAADAIRAAAKQAGFENREVLSVETGFSWVELAVCADSLSLFADQKLIDLRLPTGKPGAEGSKALLRYCEQLFDDTILLITAGKIAPSSQKAKWFQMLDKVGVIVQVWPQEGHNFLQWLQRRASAKGLMLDPEAAKFLAAQTEGNLLAAAQEIEKLYVLNGAGQVDYQTAVSQVTDSARYDVFKLVDCILSGNVPRILRILPALRGEGIAEPVVLWAISREVRTLITVQQQLSQGMNRDQVFKKQGIWDKRKSLVNQALSRLTMKKLHQVLLLAAQVDQQIKGQSQGDAWESLLQCCLVFADGDVLPEVNR